MDSIWVKIIICVAICLGLGIASGFSTAGEINGWYQTIQKPSWNPPSKIFGPVWTVLYILMGIALALIWQSSPSPYKNTAIAFFVIQFVLNLLWSFIFFNQHNLRLATIEVLLMWVVILLTIVWFYKINPVAAWLMLPYLLWVSFASYLTFTIYKLNS